MLELSRIGKQFSPNLPYALREITCTIPKGKLVGLIGPDGAGKTTLIRLMTGLLLPTEGTLTVDRTSLGYMPQRFGLYEDLTVLENLELYAELRSLPKEKIQTTFTTLLQFSGLAQFTQRLARDLSGGMKQKLGLACALLKKPNLLLLDEPTVGVDPISRRELWEMLNTLLDGERTVIWSTAYLDEAEKCDLVLNLNVGKLLFFGKPKDFSQAHASFAEAFIATLGEKKEAIPVPVEQVEQTVEFPIIADKLTKKFGSFTAANEISFEVKKGEIFGLLGPNGAGKSTTFKMLCGLEKPTTGGALINGISLKQNLSEARRHIGYMAQKFSLYGNLTVRQNLELFGSLYCVSAKKKKERIDEMISTFELLPYLDQLCDVVPIGFKQKIAFAAAALHSPQVLFLDEPTSGMDPLSRKIFWQQIQCLSKQGCTIMVTTHFLDEAEYCDRIALLYQSKIIYLGTHQALKEQVRSEKLPNPTLDDAFVAFIRGQK